MNLGVKKILMVVAPKNFRDEELLEPKRLFEEYGARVTIASTANESTGMLGARVRADKMIESIDVDEYDAVIFVGGSGSSAYFNNSYILGMAKKAYDSGKITAAICIAPSILANAGILKGKNATSYPSEKGNLEAKGAVYTGKAVTQDGKIITANGPQAARQFAETISKSL
jgi:protease I